MKNGVLLSLATILCAATLANAQETMIPFTVTGLEIGEPVDGIKAEMPNECFTLTGMTLYQDNQEVVGNISADPGQLFLNVAVSDEGSCADNEYAKLWRETLNSSQGGNIYTVNGSRGSAIRKSESRVIYTFYLVKFVDDDNTLLKQELVGRLLSATPPEVPDKEAGVTFAGWNGSYIDVDYNLTLKAVYHDSRFDVTFCDAGYLEPSYCSTQKVALNNAAVPPELPAHKGVTFDRWNTDYSKITMSIFVKALYTNNDNPNFVFNVTGFDFGSKVEDIKVDAPNECFDVAKKIVKRSSGDEEVESVDETEIHYLSMKVSITCDDDSLGNIWKHYLNFYSQNSVLNVVVNGKKKFVSSVLWVFFMPVTFVDYDGTVLKQEMVQEGLSATAPEDPVREGYVFRGWDRDFASVDGSLTITALYEEDYRHVVFESVSGEKIRNEMVQRGESVYAPTSWSQIGIPEPSPTTEYVYDWRRIGDSGDEIVQPQALIVVGDSVHYRAEIIDTLYLVSFFDDALFNLEALKGEKVHVGGTTEAPDAPVHKGLVFDKWNKDFSKITEPTTVTATYKAKSNPEFAFKVTGFDFGSKVEDIKVDVPNECFEVKKQIKFPLSGDQEIESVNLWIPYELKMSVSVTCDDDSLVNIWKLLLRKDIDDGVGIPVVLNGKDATAWSNPENVSEVILWYYINPVTFVDDDWTELKKEMVGMGESATAPEDPVREGYVFKGWDTDFSEVVGELTVRATYEEDMRHIVFESVSGKTILDSMVQRGKFIYPPMNNEQIEVPWSALSLTTEYVYDWRRIGDSGDEIVQPYAIIVVGDSVHYRAEITDTLYLVTFYEADIFTVDTLKREMVSVGKTIEAPEQPVHKGLVFDKWDKDFSKITEPMDVTATYKAKAIPEFVFNVTGFEFGSKVEDIKIETPNECFDVEKKIVKKYNVDNRVESVDEYEIHSVMMDVMITCDDDSLGNIWKYLYSQEHDSLNIVVNGEQVNTSYFGISLLPVTFVDYDGTILKQELVMSRHSATAPEDPVREDYEFIGWDKDFSDIGYTMTVTAKYKEGPRHVVFESVSGKTIYDERIARGQIVGVPAIYEKIEVPEPDSTVEYVYDWRRIGESGDEIIPALGTIRVGDSVHYRAEIIDTLYLVSFYDDTLFNLEALKGEKVSVGKTAEAPEAPVHKGLVFDKWDVDFSKITEPTNVTATYKAKTNPEYAFKVTGFDFGSKAGDIRVTSPGECFNVAKQIVIRKGQEDKDVESVSENETHYLKMSISLTCKDDSLANIWKLLLRKDIDGGKGIPVTLNGKSDTAWSNPDKVSEAILRYYVNPVTFVDHDGTVLKKEMVAMGGAATAPEDPVREGYVFKGWDTDFTEIGNKLTVKATYKEVPASSSSSKKEELSSSSKKDDKSSSSKGGKDAIFAQEQLPHFSVTTMARDIQIAGARVGSAYALFDMQGRVLKFGRVSTENFSLAVPRAGMYLVRVGSQMQKVALR